MDEGEVILKRYVVLFHDGKVKKLWAQSKDHIRQKYLNVRSIFEMYRK